MWAEYRFKRYTRNIEFYDVKYLGVEITKEGDHEKGNTKEKSSKSPIAVFNRDLWNKMFEETIFWIYILIVLSLMTYGLGIWNLNAKLISKSL